jgi:methylmalonyl-CoA mutase N-terminal domain/subunit
MRKAIEDQWVQRRIQDTAFERQQEIEAGERIIVGVNEFTVEEEEKHVDIEEVSEAQQRKQVGRLEEVREARDDEAVEARLDALETAARGDENLMPHIVAAVKAYATTGEICDTMRDVFGEYQPGASV